MEVTYRRMRDALIQLSKGVQKGPAVDLVPVLFGEKPPIFLNKTMQFTPFNKSLDNSQVFPPLTPTPPPPHHNKNIPAITPGHFPIFPLHLKQCFHPLVKNLSMWFLTTIYQFCPCNMLIASMCFFLSSSRLL